MFISKNKASSLIHAQGGRDQTDSLQSICLWISTCFLGLAVFVGDGMGSMTAKILLCIATFFSALAPWIYRFRVAPLFLKIILLILVVIIFAIPVTRIPGYYLQASSQPELPIWLGLRSAAAVAGIACWFFVGRFSKALFCFCCAALLGAGFWTLRASPQPAIDVYFFFKSSIAHAWEGINPYSQAMPNIYGQGTTLYAQNLIQGDFLRFGFPYPLGSLIVAAVSDLFFKDYRLGALLLYVCMAGWLGMRNRQDRRIALLALFFPRLEFVFEQGWSDDVSGALLLAAAVFSSTLGGSVFAGLWIASKQYLLPFLIPWLCYSPAKRKATLICLIVTGLLYLLPLLNHPNEYLWSVFGLQFVQPFRPDSLSFLFGPNSLLIIACICWLLGLWPRIQSMQASPRFQPSAVFDFVYWALWAFFIFNKQSFANYMFTLYLLTLWVSGKYLDRCPNK